MPNIDLNLHLLLPELILLAAGFAAIVTELILPADRRAVATAYTSLLGLIVALGLLLFRPAEGVAMQVMATGADGSSHMVTGWVADGFAHYVRALVVFTGILVVLLSMTYTKRMDKGHGEFYALILFALFGVMLVSGVTDLLNLFVSLELVTITAFILAAFKRTDLRSAEAGLKYLVIGAVSTGILLLGIAFLYGHTGSLSFAAIGAASGGPLLYVGLALLLTGLLFKVGGVPFHVWIPDVYQGAPTPVTAFLATASKTAGLVLAIKVTDSMLKGSGLRGHELSWVAIIGAVAVVTLLFGTLAAIPQRNIKRMLGYSSIGHAGYMLMGIAALAAAGPEAGDKPISALLFYLLAYAFTSATAFAVIVLVGASSGTHESSGYMGLAKRSPFLAFAMALSLLSLAGVPPMSGFFGKFLILTAAVEGKLVVLALVGAVGVVISLYFYLCWIRDMYMREPVEGASTAPIRVAWSSSLVIWIGIAGMLAMGIAMGPFHGWAEKAAQALGVFGG